MVKWLAVTLITVLMSGCHKNNKDMKLSWKPLSVNGLVGDLQKGVSASYAALIQNRLIVAGGANFPGKLGFEGGSKAFYDEILMYDDAMGEWRTVGALPQPSAYGVSVGVPDGALWIGGNTASEALDNVYKVTLSGDLVHLDVFPSLPAAIDNFAGCSLGNQVFVGGGVSGGKPSNSVYSIDASFDRQWSRLPDYPGLPRVQPVMAAVENEGQVFVYLMGGFFGGDAHTPPAMATEVLRYSVADKVWEVVAKQWDEETDLPFSIGGAVAMPVNNWLILCLGGVNHDVFLNAIQSQYAIANDSSLSAEEKTRRNIEFSKTYMTQPLEYYNFNSECRLFDIKTKSWTTLDKTADAARAGATLVYDANEAYVVQGELKPGVRSNVTWAISIE